MPSRTPFGPRAPARRGETPGAPVCQRGYSEHVIRSPLELNRLRANFDSNPLRWELDRQYPENT